MIGDQKAPVLSSGRGHRRRLSVQRRPSLRQHLLPAAPAERHCRKHHRRESQSAALLWKPGMTSRLAHSQHRCLTSLTFGEKLRLPRTRHRSGPDHQPCPRRGGMRRHHLHHRRLRLRYHRLHVAGLKSLLAEVPNGRSEI